MTLITGANNQAQVLSKAINLLAQLRDVLASIQEFEQWLIGLQNPTDLESLGFSATDVQAIMSAFADANALAQIYLTGLPPGSYPQPPSAFVYSASQRVIIGPS